MNEAEFKGGINVDEEAAGFSIKSFADVAQDQEDDE